MKTSQHESPPLASPFTLRFNRACSLIGLSVLLLTIGLKCAIYEHRHIPQMQDYPQYYMGGLVARSGAWDALYPIPNPNSHTNPGFVGNSELRPAYRALALSHGITEESVRYMQPPPLALLLIPLSWLPLKVSFYLWVLLLILATWGIGRQAGIIFQMCIGRLSRGSGLILLLVCFSLQAHRWIRVGNMSAVIGWLIGFTTIELVRRDSPRPAAAMTLGALAKYALLVLGPLQIALRRWRTIGWEIIFSLGLLAISCLTIPRIAFQTFFHEIVPTLGRSSIIGENSGLIAFLLRLRGVEDDASLPPAWRNAFHAAEILSLLFILALILTRRRSFWNPVHIFAAAVALIAWLLLFSPIFWEHYQAYLAPFWGWLIYEATRSRLRTALVTFILALIYVPWSILFSQLHLARPPEPFFSQLTWGTLLMLILAIDRLLRRPPIAFGASDEMA